MVHDESWQAEIDKYDLSKIVPARLHIIRKVMERVRDQGRAFEMPIYQNIDLRYREISRTETELQAAGHAASLDGWLAVSPEFEAVGGWVDYDGGPIYGGYSGHDAIYSFLVDRPLTWGENDRVHIGDFLTDGEQQGQPKLTAADMLKRLAYIEGNLAISTAMAHYNDTVIWPFQIKSLDTFIDFLRKECHDHYDVWWNQTFYVELPASETKTRKPARLYVTGSVFKDQS